MSRNSGFITLHRQILDWEWYKDINTKVLFLHLLLKANYKDLNFEGKKILRGQLVTSLPSLSSQTGLTVRQIRVSLDKLKMTGEVTSTTYPRHRVITIVNYNEYQDDDRLVDRQMTGEMSAKGQADDRLMTASKQYNNNNKGTIETKEQEKRVSAKRFAPPTREDILSFCQTEGLTIDADRFLDYYQSNGWKVGRNPMKDWKATVRNWARKDSKPASGGVRKVVAQDYEQRAYDEERTETPEEMLRRLQAEMEW